MSEQTEKFLDDGDDQDAQAQHNEIADIFGRSSDPLAEYDAKFRQIDVDPFELYKRENLQARGLTESAMDNHERALRQWKEYMEEIGRHPACPNDQQVREYATQRIESGQWARHTAKTKLQKLRQAYCYSQDEASFPHSNDYDPFRAAMQKLDLSREDPKDPYPMTLEDVRRKLGEVKHVRDRAMIGCQFKWGVRASELVNIKLSEIHITNSELLDYYDEMGTHPGLDDRKNAVFIPHDRKRNKSERPRVIPIDEEVRQLLIDYLLTRPDNGQPWAFVSKDGQKRVDRTNLNDAWVDNFRPEFGSNERFRGVSSHYGRHFFSTYMHEETTATRSQVQYLRGDKQQSGDIMSTRDAIDSYIHVYHEDVEDIYRTEIFKFRL